MSPADNSLIVNLGGLESVASVYKCASNGLSEFNKQWSAGETPSITWDMRNLKSGRMNVAAISFFLAIAHRVTQFTKNKQSCLIEWNPKALGFLADIGFFYISNYYGLFDWPYEIGGYESGKTNPNTRLLTCSQLNELPNYQNVDQVSEYKKVHREYYRDYIISRCEALFTESDNKWIGEETPLILSRTCAELATNSLLWGRSTSFIGLQRSTKSIFISVSDIGVGFRASFNDRGLYQGIFNNNNSDVASVAIGSAVNKHGFGLKRAISTVIDHGGTISITSNTGEIFWNKPLWTKFVDCFDNDNPTDAIKILPLEVHKASKKDKEIGYVRRWSHPIRGSRISFTMPKRKNEYQ